MPNFFHAQKTPDSKKNFFQNYSDHMDYLQKYYYEGWLKYRNIRTLEEKLDFIEKHALQRLTVFERLRDAHDYFDEVVGATALPALGLLVSVASLGLALWEGVKLLAAFAGLGHVSAKEYKENVIEALIISAATFLLSITSFLKSAVSIISRPVITCIKGYEKQDKDRFLVEKTVFNAFSKL